jgi:hypothetical protein
MSEDQKRRFVAKRRFVDGLGSATKTRFGVWGLEFGV